MPSAASPLTGDVHHRAAADVHGRAAEDMHRHARMWAAAGGAAAARHFGLLTGAVGAELVLLEAALERVRGHWVAR